MWDRESLFFFTGPSLGLIVIIVRFAVKKEREKNNPDVQPRKQMRKHDMIPRGAINLDIVPTTPKFAEINRIRPTLWEVDARNRCI